MTSPRTDLTYMRVLKPHSCCAACSPLPMTWPSALEVKPNCTLTQCSSIRAYPQKQPHSIPQTIARLRGHSRPNRVGYGPYFPF